MPTAQELDGKIVELTEDHSELKAGERFKAFIETNNDYLVLRDPKTNKGRWALFIDCWHKLKIINDISNPASEVETLRDRVAIEMLKILVVAPNGEDCPISDAVYSAFQYADEFMKQRNK